MGLVARVDLGDDSASARSSLSREIYSVGQDHNDRNAQLSPTDRTLSRESRRRSLSTQDCGLAGPGP